MTAPTIYTFTAGETVSLALLATGDATGATVRAALKACPAGGGRPPADAPEAEVFAAAFSTAAVPGPPPQPGWLLTLSPAETMALAPGDYETDARVTLAGGAVVTTERVIVRLVRGVTNPS